jgi:hypothetical protein
MVERVEAGLEGELGQRVLDFWAGLSSGESPDGTVFSPTSSSFCDEDSKRVGT